MSGQITRKEVIEDELLKFGEVYTENVKKAIEINKEFVNSLIALNAENIKLRKAEDRITYIKQQNEIKLIREKNISLLKEQFIAETNGEKVRQEALKTQKLEIDVINKKANAQQRSNKLTIEERVQNEVNNKLLKQAAREKLGLVGAYEKLNNARTQAKNKLRDLMAAEERNIVAIKKAQKEYDVLDAKVRKADKAVGDFTKNVGNYPFSNAASGLRNLIGAFGLTTGIALFAGIMKGAYDTIKQFEQGVADLQAITGATGKDLDFLKNSALDLGKTVKGGAIAVVEAYKLIASAKPELLENVQALNSVTKSAIELSQAAGMELPEAATALTDALNQFNAPAEKAGEFVDALANGAKYGAAEIPQTTEALLKFGAVARTSNISIQESVALIELLAENGIKGAEAGTKLRNVLLKISAPDALPKEARAEFERLGISLNFLKDTTIPIQEKLEKLKPLLKDNSSIVKIFGDENATAAINVLSHTDRLGELIPKMGEFGTAAEQAEIRMNTLNGKTDILKSTYDTLVLSIGEGSGVVSTFFKTFVEGATDALNGLIRLNTSWDGLFGKSATKGVEDGKKLYQDVFKEIFKPLSSKEKKAIEDKIKAIDEEINKASTSNQKAAELRGQKEGLLARLISADPVANKKAIRAGALSDLETLQKEYGEVNKKLEEYKDNAFKAARTYGMSESDMNARKEELIGRIAQEKEIIRQTLKGVNAKVTTETDKTGETSVIPGETSAQKAKRLAAAKKAIEEYIKLLQQRNKDEFELNQFRLEREIYYNQLIVDDETKTIEERVNASLNIEQLQKASSDARLKYELKNNALASESLKTLSKEQINNSIKTSEKEVQNLINTGKLKENATNEEILAYEKYQLEIKKLDDKSIENKQKLIDSQVAIAQEKIDQELKIQEIALNKELEAENNTYADALEKAKGNQAEIEKATLEHEQRVFDIKKRFSLKGLDLQIKELENQLATNDAKDISEQISTKERNDLVLKLSKYREERNRLDNENFKQTKDNDLSAQEQFNQRVTELSFQLKDAFANLASAIFDNKASKIDEEMQYWDEYYDEQINMATKDARQKALLEDEKERKRKELEKKKKKSEYDAAVFSRIISLGTIAAQTAMASIAAVAPPPIGLGPVAGLSLLPFIIGLGAVQAAAVLAAPLPKYKGGRLGGPAELAVTGDGGRVEVLSDPDGFNPIFTPSVPTLTYLKEDQMVHKSVDDYHKFVRNSTLKQYDKTANEVKQFNFVQNNTSNSDIDKLIEKGIKDGFKNVNHNVNIENKIDFGHELWRLSNINWKK